jgi:hypothetical protein
MATELETAQQQLIDVRAAISGVLQSGQAYSVMGRSFTKADLAQLREMESDLIARVARLSASRGVKMQRAVPL